MERCIKPIGGEFWFYDGILNNEINNFNNIDSMLLNGGQSSLEFILQDIHLKEHEFILMPSYLCPTILYKFTKKDINVVFYEINEDLSINLNNVKELIERFNVKALFFIDYFGFYHKEETLTYFKTLKENGIILIEDAVQMLWFNKLNKFIGDYVFNSYRKFFPCDGSMVLCPNPIKYSILKDEYYILMAEARTKKTEYIKSNIGAEEDFLNKFSEAEEWYYKRETINAMDIESRNYLDHVDYPMVSKQRLNNYVYLYDKLKNIKEAKILFNKDRLKDNVPLTMPLLINNRDFVRKELRKYNIYCPIHWDITQESFAQKFIKSQEVSKSILSIPIDWRYDEKDMDCFLEKFISILMNNTK